MFDTKTFIYNYFIIGFVMGNIGYLFTITVTDSNSATISSSICAATSNNNNNNKYWVVYKVSRFVYYSEC